MATSIRPATTADSHHLYVIEDDGMAGFAAFGLHQLATKKTPPGIYDTALAAGRVWIAETDTQEPIGFLAADILDGNAYLKEVSVRHAWQGKGVGRALVMEFLSWARREGFAEATLTTFRDPPTNAPFYASCGFAAIGPGPQRPQLAAQRQSEAHLDAMAPRVAMAVRTNEQNPS